MDVIEYSKPQFFFTGVLQDGKTAITQIANFLASVTQHANPISGMMMMTKMIMAIKNETVLFRFFAYLHGAQITLSIIPARTDFGNITTHHYYYYKNQESRTK